MLFMVSASATSSLETILLGSVVGAIFVFGFFAFSESVGRAGTAISTVSSRLSVFIPVLLSIIIFKEKPGFYHLFGFLFTFFTILLFYFSLKSNKYVQISIRDYFFLFGVLVGVGIADFSLKLFQNIRPQTDKEFFIFSIFLFAFIYTAVIILVKKIKLNKHTVISGGVLGIPNVFSSVFLLGALEKISAMVVYPTVNIGVILLTALLAFIIWKERLNLFSILSLISGIISIILLTL